MTKEKDFKRVVRRRMTKTGESYTAARATLLRKPTSAARPDEPQSVPQDYARLAGMADATLKAKTGCDWARWVYVLDRVKAHEWPHREIVSHVVEKYDVPGWWAQMVTVGYERIKGLRAKGQRRDGGFEASKSRTFPVPVSRLYKAFRDKRQRAKWLDTEIEIRAARPDRSLRITWPDGTNVMVWFVAKGNEKTQVAIAHAKLPSAEVAAGMKEYWNERLDALKEALPVARQARKSR
jgi:uncharacterized protein YndB with AHSA1/START domain